MPQPSRTDLAYQCLLEAIGEETTSDGLTALGRVFDKFTQKFSFSSSSNHMHEEVQQALFLRYQAIMQLEPEG